MPRWGRSQGPALTARQRPTPYAEHCTPGLGTGRHRKQAGVVAPQPGARPPTCGDRAGGSRSAAPLTYPGTQRTTAPDRRQLAAPSRHPPAHVARHGRADAAAHRPERSAPSRSTPGSGSDRLPAAGRPPRRPARWKPVCCTDHISRHRHGPPAGADDRPLPSGTPEPARVTHHRWARVAVPGPDDRPHRSAARNLNRSPTTRMPVRSCPGPAHDRPPAPPGRCGSGGGWAGAGRVTPCGGRPGASSATAAAGSPASPGR